MSEIRVLIEQLVKAGVDPVEAAEVVSRAAIHGAASAPRGRSAGAIRQERYRRNKASQVTESNASDTLLSPEGSSPTPPSPKPHSSNPPSPPKGGSSPAGFEQFWVMFPNKVGKRDAEKAFAKAIQRASLEAILAGLRRYAAKTDDRPWCNPATFLNQNRWEDQPAPVPHRQATAPPGHRQTAVEANIARRIKRNEPASGRCDYIDAELLPPDKSELRSLVGELGQAMRWPVGSGHN